MASMTRLRCVTCKSAPNDHVCAVLKLTKTHARSRRQRHTCSVNLSAPASAWSAAAWPACLYWSSALAAAPTALSCSSGVSPMMALNDSSFLSSSCHTIKSRSTTLIQNERVSFPKQKRPICTLEVMRSWQRDRLLSPAGLCCAVGQPSAKLHC